MNANEALQYYTAIKLHFTNPSYDFFQYRGQVKYALDLGKRKDKWQLQKIAKHPDPFGLLVCNLSINPGAWTGDIISDVGLKRYKEWQKRNESLTYTFEQDLKKLKPKFPDNTSIPPSEHPYLLKLYLGEHICIESFVILNFFFDLKDRWDMDMPNDIIWRSIRMSIQKYAPFVKFDRLKCLDAVRKEFMPNK